MNCKNCHKTLKDTQKFCDDCGAKVIHNRLTPKVLIQQVNEEFWTFDNKFLNTVINLIKKPETVINGYIVGIRKRYIGVIPFYAVALTVLGFQMFVLKTFFPEFLESQSSAFTDAFKESSNGAKNPFDGFQDAMNDYQGVIFSLFMPFIAVGTWILYLDKRKYNYTEHLVINLYMTAQTIYFNFIIIISLALFNVKDYMFASFVSLPPLILYGAYVFKRLYKTSFLNALIRYIAAYFIYTMVFGILMVVILILVGLYLFATGNINF